MPTEIYPALMLCHSCVCLSPEFVRFTIFIIVFSVVILQIKSLTFVEYAHVNLIFLLSIKLCGSFSFRLDYVIVNVGTENQRNTLTLVSTDFYYIRIDAVRRVGLLTLVIVRMLLRQPNVCLEQVYVWHVWIKHKCLNHSRVERLYNLMAFFVFCFCMLSLFLILLYDIGVHKLGKALKM